MNQNALQAKKNAVNEIVSSFDNAGSLTVVSYQGLTVAELQELRRTLEGVKLHSPSIRTPWFAVPLRKQINQN